jgi:hypothetical protein
VEAADDPYFEGKRTLQVPRGQPRQGKEEPTRAAKGGTGGDESLRNDNGDLSIKVQAQIPGDRLPRRIYGIV